MHFLASMGRIRVLVILLTGTVALAACGARDTEQASSRSPALAPTAPPPPPAASIPAPSASPLESAPATSPAAQAAPLYVCAIVDKGAEQRTPIELSAPVDALCRKAPEMGPCQYERETCRRKGGRVWTTDGREITRETEAEYDRRVMRIRMKSN
jgi:predicted secreted protein